ncbi:leucine Rich Repeat domain-containing protein [Nannizzia gypsea CBS 118893]|uniref:Leucine Rich Repeat domain-containing protein n=1 Tax=Arthroderma gypseum (strain ATCC MYA-4604 / CBS 118893) TaxID=535722 RepID=E4V150_ARTGP|nr:leucine Rich Repeat domain-containing protein [Nannizzia gypsea CBS 118893]EFR03765.1 leucine Rich Repeat domain-containing protein [Nannizzia gypsea CBS 118893]
MTPSDLTHQPSPHPPPLLASAFDQSNDIDLPDADDVEDLKIAAHKRQDSFSSSQARSHSRSSSIGGASFGSIEEDNTGIAQSFVDTKESNSSGDKTHAADCSASKAKELKAPIPDFCCPCGTFRGWKQIRLGGRKLSRSYSDLRLLGGTQARGWAWEEEIPDPAPLKAQQQQYHEEEDEEEEEEGETLELCRPTPRVTKRACLERLPVEILDEIISHLALDIPPNGYTPRNVDLISCLLTCRTLHSATLGVLYRHITIPHSIIFSKALNHIRQYPSLGTIVRRLDFSHFTSVGLGRTQQMNVEIQNLTAKTLLQCLDLLPNLKELLLQEHVEDDVDGDVVRKIFISKTLLRAVDFCGCSSAKFSSGFLSAVTQEPKFPSILPNIRRLSLHECTGLPDEAFQSLLPRLTNLTHLDVAHTQISNSTLFLIPYTARITHLNISRCTKLTGPEVVRFLSTHPAVTSSLVYLNLMVDASRHRILEEADVPNLLPHLKSTLRSLNLGGARISSAHMPDLLRLSKHVEELGLSSADLTLEDINSFFAPPSSSSATATPWEPSHLRYLDLTRNPYLTQAALFNSKSCLLVTPQSYPLLVIEMSERLIAPLRARSKSSNNRSGWVVRELGRRGWYVREPSGDPSMPVDDGQRSWKMGAHWWGTRKIPVSVGDVGGIYGHYMFKK